ncbi:hypothetical protein HDV04_003523 [Boothiomyces sp. JEL0838]|nr:hypothetical protein HDV04_003523 [Boothiomyces sp. JEL0838]
MGKRVNTCLNCKRKKIKCSRERPKCSACIASKSFCVYSNHQHNENPTGNNQSAKQVLEKDVYPVKDVNPVKDVTIKAPSCFTEIKQSPLVDQPLTFDLNGEFAEKLFLEYIADSSSMAVQGWQSASQSCPILKYSARGLGYDLLGQHQNASKSLKFASQYLTQVISCHSITAIQGLNRFDEGAAYYKYAIQMAKEIGINREERLKTICSAEPDKEEIRKLWWYIYTLDQFFKIRDCSILQDCDNGLFLPESKEPSAIVDRTLQLGMLILSSSELFTPPFETESILVCRILLIRILGKILDFINAYHEQENKVNIKYAISVLEGSLQLWWNNLPATFKEYLHSGEPLGGKWLKVMETALLYNFARAFVITPLILNHNANSKDLKPYIQFVSIAKDNTELLNSANNSGPSFPIPPPSYILSVYHLTILIYLNTTFELPVSLSLQLQLTLYQHLNFLKEVLRSTGNGLFIILSTSLGYLKQFPHLHKLAIDFLNDNMLEWSNKPLFSQKEPVNERIPNYFEFIKDPE